MSLKKFILNIFLVFAIYVSLFSFQKSFEDSPDGYEILWLIPFVYTILLSITNIKHGIFKYLGLTIIQIILYARYILVTYFILQYEIFYHSAGYRIEGDDNKLAIWLIVFEMFVIFFVLHRGLKSIEQIKTMYKYILIKNENNNFLYLLIALGLISFALSQPIRDRTNFLFAKDFGESEINTLVSFGLIFTQFSLKALLVIVISRYFKIKKLRNSRAEYFILFIALLQVFIFWSGSRLTVLANAVSVGYFLFQLRIFSKLKMGLLLVGCIFILISISSLRTFGDGQIQTFRNEVSNYYTEQITIDYLQSYFAGPSLIATSIRLKDQVHSINLETFFNEIIGSWLFIRQLFPPSSNQSTVHFNYIFGHNEQNSMILPTLGQSYYYFGFLGFFILPFIFSKLLIFAEIQHIKSSTLIYKYSYIFMISWFAFFPMQNLNIISSTLFNVAGPMFLFSFINTRFNMYRL